MMTDVLLQQYLSRIYYQGRPKTDFSTLQQITLLHPKHIPFENITTFTGGVPSLDENAVFEKLIVQKRGGYCFEHNLLLKSVLEKLGFETIMCLARVVWGKQDDIITPKTHAMLMVTNAGQKYIIDSGFGAITLTAPLQLSIGISQQTPNGIYSISQKEDGFLLSYKNEKWLPIYKFRPESVENTDIEMANWYVATFPSSIFRENLMISMTTREVTSTLSDTTLSFRYPDRKKQISILDPSDIPISLKKKFGISISLEEENILIGNLLHKYKDKI